MNRAPIAPAGERPPALAPTPPTGVASTPTSTTSAPPASPPTLARSTAAAPTPATTPRFGDVRLPAGVRLRFAEQGDAGGRALILLHGYSDSWFSFSRVLPLLPGDLHVLALDQRGHGDSDRPISGYAMRDLAADVLALMDAKGIAHAVVVGHSMGSFVAQQVALAAPTRVERLVLIGSTTTPRNIGGMYELKAAVEQFAPDEAAAPVEFAREFQYSTVNLPVPEEFMEEAVATSGKLPARVWRAVMDGMLATDPPVALGAGRIPTLLLWGELDPFAPRAEREALRRLLAAARVTEYPGTGHAPHWERPADVARDVAAFVRGEPRR